MVRKLDYRVCMWVTVHPHQRVAKKLPAAGEKGEREPSLIMFSCKLSAVTTPALKHTQCLLH